MAIKYYIDNPRSDGYRGIRVSCSIDGKKIQEYFHHENQEEAEDRHEYLMDQVAHRGSRIAMRHSQQYAYSAARYDPPRRTGIVGITMSFQEQKKCTPVRHYPSLVIAHQDKTREVRNITSRCITKRRDLEATWLECCKLLAQWRDYQKVPDGWYALCPSRKDWLKLRRFYNKKGEGIMLSSLDVI